MLFLDGNGLYYYSVGSCCDDLFPIMRSSGVGLERGCNSSSSRDDRSPGFDG